ncbi:glycerophosphodiester phosphodiesterase family protein [Marinobacter sp.]|jgi:glycerophosphoryl diester phosphodiesterase|uniref:glycerophosphodiester phosphodiesterase family protein n=1 Tax=Marinobacter sp. TaxID=50741 RepID=UPI000C0E805F|nr:glycerophosphodiester phosphodiesterase family protein [Marinobacter sp.]MBE96502.1 glycerophosphodiester phosphodiesterase [Marinobacter sp.]MBP54907.1 glycerophosphodiester phosphodiesterase [Marinobacter sp.]PHQ73011.1 MAG: glycerophosphodiester phosphodiesterase [Marinobacter sp.]
MKILALHTLAFLHVHRRALLVFYLFFTGLVLAAIAPLFSSALAALRPITGHAAISTGGLVQFVVSPGGLLWISATATLTALLVILQQAGMTWIAASGGGREYRIAIATLWALAQRFKQLLTLTLLQLGGHALIAVPFLLAIVVSYQWLISPHDIYYLKLERPPEVWWFLGIAGVAALGIAVCNGWLYLRWVLSVPLVLLDGHGARLALRLSNHHVHGQRLPATGALLAGLAGLAILPILVTLAFQGIGSYLLPRLPEQMDLLMPVTLTFVALYILFTITLAFAGIAAYSMLIYSVYRQATGHRSYMSSKGLPKQAGPLAWTAEALVVVLAMGQAWLVLQSFEQQDKVSITAHRGSALKAPENTLSAIQQAIEDGADYIEVDVRMTADGVPVLWHDADMRRVFGLDGKISDITLQEAREQDAGAWFAPQFSNERIATLEEVIEKTRGRAYLYVDIKPDPDTPALTREVVSLLNRMEATEGAVIATAEWSVLAEARELAPELKTTLLAQFIVGPLWEQSFDILGLRQNRVTPTTVARAHRSGKELHVWTVNSPDAMSRFIDMGVDNIITDRPDVLAELLERRNKLTDAEVLVVKLRNWLL